MPHYKYVAKDTAGKTVQGVLEEPSREALIEKLRKENLIIILIEDVKKTKAREKTVKLEELAVFSRQLATMVDAGIPVAGSLEVLGEQIENKYFRHTVSEVHMDILRGQGLSQALAKHPRVFSSLYINMVKAGESSGTLDEILDRVAAYLEKTAALKHKVVSSLVYPAVVSSMALIITLVLIIKVIPAFKNIFDILGGQLPLPTRMLIAFSELTRRFFPYLLAAFVIFVMLLRQYVRTEKGRLIFDRALLKMPIFGNLFRKVTIARFARTLATLVRSGVQILVSLEIVAKTSGNKVVENALMDVRKSIREGENIATPLARYTIFPRMVVRMISVGEQTGQLEKMLDKIAEFYEEQVDSAVGALTSVIEPVVIAFLGLIVGTIVIAMFLPIFKITQLIQ